MYPEEGENEDYQEVPEPEFAIEGQTLVAREGETINIPCQTTVASKDRMGLYEINFVTFTLLV